MAEIETSVFGAGEDSDPLRNQLDPACRTLSRAPWWHLGDSGVFDVKFSRFPLVCHFRGLRRPVFYADIKQFEKTQVQVSEQ